MENKYKVGQKVRVRSLGALKRGKGEDWRDSFKVNFTKGLDSLCELSLEIVNNYKDVLVVEPHYNRYELSSDMLEGYAFEYGDEIEVSDDGEEWRVRKYICYIDGEDLPYRCVMKGEEDDFEKGSSYNTVEHAYARPIQTDTIEITLKINGEVKPLSCLSKESLKSILEGE